MASEGAPATIYATIPRPPKALVDRFRKVRLEVLVQMRPSLKLMDPAIKPLGGRDWLIAGPAVTVAIDAPDTLMAVAAMAVVQAGDVVVIAANGDCRRASWGSGLSLSAKNRGCEAAVVDGAGLDASEMLKRGLPVFCRTSTLAHRPGQTPGSVNVEVICGGVEVRPGDLILGDRDGAMVLPLEDLEAMVDEAEERSAAMAARVAQLEADGRTLLDLRGGQAMLEAFGIQLVQ